MHKARRLLLILPVVLVATGLLASVAHAAPDRSFALSAADTSESWTGSGAFGVTPLGVYECKPAGAYNCDDSVIDLKDAGTLKATGSTSDDFLMSFHLYKATADGGPDGEPIAEGELASDFNLTVKDLAPAQYLLRIVFRAAAAADFEAKATLTPNAPPEADPVATAPVTTEPAPTPAQTTQPAKKKSKKASCRAKARKIKKASKRKAALKRCARKKRAARR